MAPLGDIYGYLGGSEPPCGCGSSAGRGTTLCIHSRFPGRVDAATTVNADRDIRVDIGKYAIDGAGVTKAVQDFAAIGEILNENPDAALALAKAVQAGNVDQAVRIAADIGLTEDELQRRGGGIGFFLIFVAAVAIVLVTPRQTSIEADPPRQPPYPLTEEEETLDDINSYLESGQ